MKIMVKGIEKELTAIGENGIEWTEDLLGNYGALHYDNEQNIYTMDGDEFEWWVPVVDMVNEVYILEQKLSEKTRAEYEKENFDYCDFDTEMGTRLEWLRKHAE